MMIAWLAACSSARPTEGTPAPAVDFNGTRWYLIAVHDTVKPGEKTPYITFQAEGKVVGFGGCNTFFGGYSKNGSHLRIDPLASTEMYCEETQALEDVFLQTLNRVTAARVEGTTLLLGTPEQPRALQFAAQP